MTQTENPPQAAIIQAFLVASRAYLALDNDLGAARQRTATSGRRSIVASVTAKLGKRAMKSYRKTARSLFLAVGLGAFVAGPALADPGWTQNDEHRARHAKMQEQRYQHLHDTLKLTTEQEPAWSRLIQSDPAKPAGNGGRTENWAKLTVLERAEKMLELSQARQQQMVEHIARLKAFYAVLTPDQQKTFEDFHAGPAGGMPDKRGAMAAPTDHATA